MPFSTVRPTNTFHAPLREKTSDELLVAIVRGQYDAADCRAELVRQGWSDSAIEGELTFWSNRLGNIEKTFDL